MGWKQGGWKIVERKLIIVVFGWEGWEGWEGGKWWGPSAFSQCSPKLNHPKSKWKHERKRLAIFWTKLPRLMFFFLKLYDHFILCFFCLFIDWILLLWKMICVIILCIVKMSRVIIVCMLRFDDPTFIIYYTYIDILNTKNFF